jgi:hypothetical protein
MIFPLVSGPSPLDTPPLPTAPKVNAPKDNIQAPKSLIEGELFSTNLDHMILEALIIFGWGWQVDSARLFSGTVAFRLPRHAAD